MTIRVGILTISDRSARGERADLTGPAVSEEIRRQGWEVVRKAIIPDEKDQISEMLIDWCDEGKLDVILTNGGTGFGPRDVTPEATNAVIDRPAPGLAEAMRTASMKVTTHAMLSRATAGLRGRVLIVNLPGSPKAAVENLGVIAGVLLHAVELLREDPHAEEGHRKVN
ncbi:MAG TPA: MogA/MoaB family molybdenum cofactor biosynthesis protein [Anaerolineaceae bacterium]|nr:MogA/MoaB family molybdenum cofactor biosynthesis protein [Anaerolineaceae bacterium]